MNSLRTLLKLCSLVPMLVLVVFAVANLDTAIADEPGTRDKKESKRDLNEQMNDDDEAGTVPERGRAPGQPDKKSTSDGVTTGGDAVDSMAKKGRAPRKGLTDKSEASETESFDDDMGEDKVTICHKPDKRAEKTLVVPAEAVDGHLGHGDLLGACPGDETQTNP